MMQHTSHIVTEMEENLVEDEYVLLERARRLSVQSIEAFKVVGDVEKLQR